MRNRSRIRTVNAVVAGIVACFFLVHALLGGLSGVVSLPASRSWLAWIGVAAIVVHIAVSIATSIQQLQDRDNPPSTRKKRHLALKWATGVALLCVAIIHIVVARSDSASSVLAASSGALLLALLALLLALHTNTGAKSLLSDLGADKQHLTALRVIIWVAYGAAAVVAIVAATMTS